MAILEEIARHAQGEVRMAYPLNRCTSFRIGGKADLLFYPRDGEALGKVRKLCHEKGVPFTLIGMGSNLLVRDGGIRGVVASLRRGFGGLKIEGESLMAGAGMALKKVADAALDASLTGLEFASAIPGSFGGAVVMNAGAYGGEMKDVLKKLTLLDDEGEVREIGAEQVGFTYRSSSLPAGSIVLAGELQLARGEREGIRRRMEEGASKRKASQPRIPANAGSVFKNPPGDYAGRLIEEAGLKGLALGEVAVSEEHANFIVNRGEGTAAQVMALMEKIKRSVEKECGVLLEEEIRILGEG